MMIKLGGKAATYGRQGRRPPPKDPKVDADVPVGVSG